MDRPEIEPDAMDQEVAAPRPRIAAVLGLLAVVALVFSYLWAYALTNALVAAEVIGPISVQNDPRPRWLITSFVSLLAVFALLGGLMRYLGWRQLRRLDALADATDEWRINDT
jgi:hypothetical protein